ncbi:DNA-deoxyinosine glycosylase [Verminephrobacter aporrectodeae]|uniref:DNA-deoxyinosine glycosylase n=1 Tax=Verminephrobacter aporrectodeae TaxID=1110389 RepID=UPI002242D0EF|nr:DNA-deoxyinosine glycosylase [Verminephrobacter aporrectodeae]
MPEAIATGATPASLPLPARGLRLHGLPAVVSAQTVVLVLGSFPGAASLRAGAYYAHPQNHFWKILQALWPQHSLPPDYPARCAWLLARGLGLWDVYASCERAGSLDSSIRNPRVNDFSRLHGGCPRLAAVAHNGAESFRHSRAVLDGLDAGRANGSPGAAVAAVRLPSSSPANASWSFARKLAAWAALMSAQRLL